MIRARIRTAYNCLRQPLAADSTRIASAPCTAVARCPVRRESDGVVRRPAESEIDYRADRFAVVHQIERLVDAIERHLMSDQVVDVDLPLHVPVDDLRYVGAAPRSAERRTFPDSAGNELKRARGDLGSAPAPPR